MRSRHSRSSRLTGLVSMLACGVLALLIGASSPLQANLWASAYSGDAQAQWQAAQQLLQQQSFSAAYPWALAAARQGQLDALSLLEQRLPSEFRQWQRWRARYDDSAVGHQARQQLWLWRVQQPTIELAELQRLWQQQAIPQPAWLGQLTRLQSYQDGADFSQQCQFPVVIQLQQRRQLAHALQLMQSWQDSPLRDFDFCFAWQQQAQLTCTTQGQRQRAACQTDSEVSDDSLYLWRFSENGIASAKQRVITLTSTSGAAVLLHEMGHWLGLADEYPMSAELASQFCRGAYQHPSLNLVVTGAQRLTAAQLQALYQRLPWRHAVDDWRQLGQRQADGRWLLGSAFSMSDSGAAEAPVGLYPVATCAQVSGYFAWRPVASATAMQQQELAHWPALYLTLMRDYWRAKSLSD